MNGLTDIFPPSTEKAGAGGGGEVHDDEVANLTRDIIQGTSSTFPPSSAKEGPPGGEINSGDDADQECKLP